MINLVERIQLGICQTLCLWHAAVGDSERGTLHIVVTKGLSRQRSAGHKDDAALVSLMPLKLHELTRSSIYFKSVYHHHFHKQQIQAHFCTNSLCA